MQSPRIEDPESRALLIHLGGLGDACLSESIFLSLSRHFGGKIDASGYTRYLGLFSQYFEKVHSIESARWLHLFSDYPSNVRYGQIVFVGKDRDGKLRERWQGLSKEKVVFIEMYPDGEFTARGPLCKDFSGQAGLTGERESTAGQIHVEEYQLAQLRNYGIAAIKKEIEPKPLNRVILYPEEELRKTKWSSRNFVDLYHALRNRGLAVDIVQSLGLELDLREKVLLDDLAEVRGYFREGGIFVSNDSGMAHFAGRCGLFTITVFSDTDPSVWHPRGRNISLKRGEGEIRVRSIEELILSLLLGLK